MNNNYCTRLVRLWTMRFEARHSYFKRLAAQMGNFINICYSLSVRHQGSNATTSLTSIPLAEKTWKLGLVKW